jgi:RNA polymerase sigma-70 factor (ECF subfamily)
VTDKGAGCSAPDTGVSVATAARAQSLADIVAAVAAGESAALAELYDSTVAKVHTLVKAIIRSAPDAEEVTCDVYLQAWQTASQFDSSRGTVMAWLLMMARSRALDSVRRQRSRARLFDEQCAHEDLPDLAHSVSPERMLSLFQTGSAVHAALEELAPERRRLIGLAFFDDLSHAEIAKLTGLPIGTIKSHLRRALHSLRGALCSAEIE